MRLNKFFTLIFVFILALPFTALAENYTLSFQILSPQNAPVSVAVQKWVKEVEEKSNGQIKFDLVYNSAITRVEGSYTGLKKGAVDISNFSPNQVANELPRATSIALPFLVGNSIEGSKVLWGLYDNIPEFKKEFDNIVILGMFTSDRNVIMGTKSPVKTPEDIKGKRVALGSAGITAEEVIAIGAEPIPIVAADTYIALQRGMGDFYYGQIGLIRALKLQEIVKYVTVLPYSTVAQYVGINKDVWNSLPANVQELLLTFEDFSKSLAVILHEDGNNDLELLRKDGIEVTILEGASLEPFEKLVKSSTRLSDFWKEILASGGVEDPAAWIAEVYSFAQKMQN